MNAPDAPSVGESASKPEAPKPEPLQGNPGLDTSRGLLFGLLALQNNFITRESLLAAFDSWLVDRSRSLGQVLLERGALSRGRHAALEALVAEHVLLHDNDAQKSLAALGSIGSLRDDLSRIADRELTASLGHVPAAPEMPRGPFDTVGASSLGASSSAGGRFHKYEKVPFARGGLGAVYLARDTELDRAVALKEIQEAHADDQNSRGRFVAEAQITGKLEHPGIVPVYGLGQDASGRPFYAMRFIRGEDLQEAIDRFHGDLALARNQSARRLRLRELLRRFTDVCNAVEYAHSRGVLHRDLKPGNIMLGPYGETLVVDWGLAKLLGARAPAEAGDQSHGADVSASPFAEGPIQPSGQAEARPYTMAGSILGTPAYASPEQLAGRLDLLGRASDVYGLGAILYSLLTGKAPGGSEGVAGLLRRLERGDLPRARSLDATIPKPLEAICSKAMSLLPEDRYPSARALANDIERWLADEPIDAYNEPWLERTRRWARRHRALVQASTLALLATTAVATASALAIYRFWRSSTAADAAKLAAEADKVKALKAERSAKETAEKAERERDRSDFARREEELRRRASEALVVDRAAGVARAEHFHQKEALDLARALTKSDASERREQWMVAAQRALVPVATSPRRFVARRVAYSPNKQYLATTELGSDSIRVWRTAGWIQERVLVGRSVAKAQMPLPTVTALAFRPDKPAELVSVGEDGIIRVWDVSTGSELRSSLSVGSSSVPMLCLSVSPTLDSKRRRRVITGDRKGRLAFWDLDDLRKINEVVGDADAFFSVCYRPNGQECAAAGIGGAVRIADFEGNRRAELITPGVKPDDKEFAIMDLAYSPDGGQLACGGSNGRIYIWDAGARRLLHQMVGNDSGLPFVQGAVTKLVYAGSTKLFAGGGDGLIKQWDTSAGRMVALRGRHGGNVSNTRIIRAMALGPDGAELATTGDDCSIRIWNASLGKPLAWLEGNQGPVGGSDFLSRAISAFAPVNHVLVTAGRGADAFLRSWDTRTLRERRAYIDPRPHPEGLFHDRITALALRPDGRRFISAEPNGDLVVWDVASGRRLLIIEKAHQRGEFPELRKDLREAFAYAVAALAWNHRGDAVASAGADHSIRLWNPETGALKEQWQQEISRTQTPHATGAERILAQQGAGLGVLRTVGQGAIERAILLFDNDDHRLITAGRDEAIRLWDLPSKSKTPHLLLLHRQRVSAAALSADGRLLASGSDDGVVAIWDLQTLVPQQTISIKPIVQPRYSAAMMPTSVLERDTISDSGAGLAERVLSLAFAPDGSWLAVVLGDGTISLVDPRTGRIVSRGIGHEFGSMGMCAIEAYFTRECELLTVGADGRVHIWELASWSKGRQILPAFGEIPPLGQPITEPGTIVHVGPSIYRLEPRSARLWAVWLGNTDPARSVSCLASDRRDGKIVFGTLGGQLIVWDVLAGKPVASMRPPTVPPKAVSQPSNRTRLFGKPGTIWNPAIAALAVQPEGPLAAVAWRDGPIDLVQIDDGTRLRTLAEAGLDVAALAFRPDGRFLAVARNDGGLKLLDVETGKPSFPDRRDIFTSIRLCYSPDGAHLAQVGASRRIVVWDAESGEQIRILEWMEAGPTRAFEELDRITGAAYSNDGRWLATCGSDFIVRIWDADPQTRKSVRSYKLLAALATHRLKFDMATAVGSVANQMGMPKPSLDSAELAKFKARDPQAFRAPVSVSFSPDSRQLVVVVAPTFIWIYDMPTVLRELEQEPEKLLSSTAEMVGVSMERDSLTPTDRNRLVSGDEPIYKDYRDTSPERMRLWATALAAGSAGRAEESRKCLEEYLREPGLFPEQELLARSALFDNFLNAVELEKADVEARKVLAIDPHYGLIRNFLANLLAMQWRFEEAERRYQEVVDDPESDAANEMLARLGLAWLKLIQGDLDQAESGIQALLEARNTTAEQARSIRPRDTKAPLKRILAKGSEIPLRSLLAQVHLKQRRFALVQGEIQNILHEHELGAGAESRIRLVLTAAHVEAGNFEKAEEEIDRSLKLADTALARRAARIARATLDVWRARNLEQAETCLRDALKSTPGDRSIEAAVGMALVKGSHFDEGLAILVRASKDRIVARDPVFWDGLGDIYRDRNEPRRARTAWLTALDVFPKTAEPGDRRRQEIQKKLAPPLETKKRR